MKFRLLYNGYLMLPEVSYETDFVIMPDGSASYMGDSGGYYSHPCLYSYEKMGQSVILMPYIGMKDMNGKDIAVDDIIRILYTDWPSKTDDNISLEDYKKSISYYGIVKYNAPEYGLLMEDKKFGGTCMSSLRCGTHGEIEIVGNIYDNPELKPC